MGTTTSISTTTPPMFSKGGQYHPKFLQAQNADKGRGGYFYCVEYSPSDRATCPECNKKIAKGELRIGRSTANPFDAEHGLSDYTKFFHVSHMFDAMMRSRKTTKVISKPSDVKGFQKLLFGDQKTLKIEISIFYKSWTEKAK